jgi:prefoldin subunit 5
MNDEELSNVLYSFDESIVDLQETIEKIDKRIQRLEEFLDKINKDQSNGCY